MMSEQSLVEQIKDILLEAVDEGDSSWGCERIDEVVHKVTAKLEKRAEKLRCKYHVAVLNKTPRNTAFIRLEKHITDLYWILYELGSSDGEPLETSCNKVEGAKKDE